ncbi:MAG: hypothetical protein DM484_11290 [Candidatus Methylumidiphilus alinenensis]|uniref:Type VI secretion system (T6SS), amidase effector protein 4 n=1 Tax=Candidatus Methylumidiphilus alinenensis TaxID=2202197 RepID=A0A2W4R5G9_9GAMM|nr:MAG: hypothetical protein DM484_11290 [Candidatus Methylumidiphilus alinenensis]
MPTFATLWNNHPTIKGESSLLDRGAYEYQCSINLSAALIRSGVNMKSYNGQLSWQKGNPKYAIRAQQLANWLASPVNPLRSKVEKYSGSEVFDKINGRSGVIFFQNYWGIGHQGDHIDLWNGYRLTDWRTWVRIHIRIGSFGLHNLGAGADFAKAETVWFWAIL